MSKQLALATIGSDALAFRRAHLLFAVVAAGGAVRVSSTRSRRDLACAAWRLNRNDRLAALFDMTPTLPQPRSAALTSRPLMPPIAGCGPASPLVECPVKKCPLASRGR